VLIDFKINAAVEMRMECNDAPDLNLAVITMNILVTGLQ